MTHLGDIGQLDGADVVIKKRPCSGPLESGVDHIDAMGLSIP